MSPALARECPVVFDCNLRLRRRSSPAEAAAGRACEHWGALD
ncbi:MAG TPA: hypothetical protein VG371_18300 [Solirubrobacteraceae bacterium]|nr:hypothetical protein [Solirubrobacteraceae bacterium]